MAFTHIRAPYAFMGYQCPMEESRVAVLPVPYDGTTSFMAGTRYGPHAIITASRQVEFYDRELDMDVAEKLGIHTLPEMEPDMGSAELTLKRVEEMADGVIKKGKFPILFGGEHSVSVGLVASLAKRHKELSVLQIDAHADLRDEYEGTKFNHACAMRRIREHVDVASQVGIRSVCRDELDYIRKAKLEEYIHWGAEFDEKKVLSQLSDAVYVSIDLDGFDPSDCPGVGTPEPGGLKWAQVLRLLRLVAEKKKILGFDVVELLPIPGSVQSEFFAAKLAYKLLGYAFFAKK
ncbi:MAG: agmatinase [Candidatus Micrarchaeota archaeon]